MRIANSWAGRWSNRLYIAISFCFAELPDDYVMLTIFIADDIAVQKTTAALLPAGWNTFPHEAATQAIGDRFVADGRYCVLQTPSAVTQGNYNFLINPNHPHFKQIKISNTERFPFDRRIFK